MNNISSNSSNSKKEMTAAATPIDAAARTKKIFCTSSFRSSNNKTKATAAATAEGGAPFFPVSFLFFRSDKTLMKRKWLGRSNNKNKDKEDGNKPSVLLHVGAAAILAESAAMGLATINNGAAAAAAAGSSKKKRRKRKDGGDVEEEKKAFLHPPPPLPFAERNLGARPKRSSLRNWPPPSAAEATEATEADAIEVMMLDKPPSPLSPPSSSKALGGTEDEEAAAAASFLESSLPIGSRCKKKKE